MVNKTTGDRLEEVGTWTLKLLLLHLSIVKGKQYTDMYTVILLMKLGSPQDPWIDHNETPEFPRCRKSHPFREILCVFLQCTEAEVEVRFKLSEAMLSQS